MTDRQIIEALGELRTKAPAEIAENVLLATGLVDQYAKVEGPIGRMYVAFNRRGVSAIVPAEDEATFLEIFASRVGRRPVPGELPDRIARNLDKALTTGRLGRLPVDLSHLTEFQQAVLRKTAEIPPGEMRTYGWIAREIGKPGAVRAVGSALNKNPVPVVIPCHRVGKSDGTIGEYAFGTDMKRELLTGEGLDPDYESLATRGVRFTGSDTTRIYCFPTCRHARRTTPTHQVEFRSARDAEASGYRGCKVCRPAA